MWWSVVRTVSLSVTSVSERTDNTLAGPTEAAVLQELKNAEAQEAAEGREAVSETKSTAAAFIKAGLQIEESQ
jgi:hypothetical protein